MRKGRDHRRCWKMRLIAMATCKVISRPKLSSSNSSNSSSNSRTTSFSTWIAKSISRCSKCSTRTTPGKSAYSRYMSWSISSKNPLLLNTAIWTWMVTPTVARAKEQAAPTRTQEGQALKAWLAAKPATLRARRTMRRIVPHYTRTAATTAASRICISGMAEVMRTPLLTIILTEAQLRMGWLWMALTPSSTRIVQTENRLNLVVIKQIIMALPPKATSFSWSPLSWWPTLSQEAKALTRARGGKVTSTMQAVKTWKMLCPPRSKMVPITLASMEAVMAIRLTRIKAEQVPMVLMIIVRP